MLRPTQTFLELLLFFAILETILFAGIVYFYEMTKGEIVGLGVAAVVMLIRILNTYMEKSRASQGLTNRIMLITKLGITTSSKSGARSLRYNKQKR